MCYTLDSSRLSAAVCQQVDGPVRVGWLGEVEVFCGDGCRVGDVEETLADLIGGFFLFCCVFGI